MHGYFLRDTQPASKGRRGGGGTHKHGQLGPKDGIFIDFFFMFWHNLEEREFPKVAHSVSIGGEHMSGNCYFRGLG